MDCVVIEPPKTHRNNSPTKLIVVHSHLYFITLVNVPWPEPKALSEIVLNKTFIRRNTCIGRLSSLKLIIPRVVWYLSVICEN